MRSRFRIVLREGLPVLSSPLSSQGARQSAYFTHYSTLTSASYLDGTISTVFAALGGSRVEEKLSTASYRDGLRQGTPVGSNLHRCRAHSLELDKLQEHCWSSPGRGSAVIASTFIHQKNVPRGASVFVDGHLQHVLSRSCPPYSFRSMSTAVSSEYKIRSEAEDEELDVKRIEDSLLTSKDKQRNSPAVKDGEGSGEEEIAETSIYTVVECPTQFSSADINKYFTLSSQDQERLFGEGLPAGLLKEFEETKESSFLIRAHVLQLFERFKKYHANVVRLKDQGEVVRTSASKPRQCLLEGFNKGGKTVALAMLVHWARTQGWLVFYVPSAKEWTTGGMYYKSPHTGLWDTPVQAKTVLEGFFRSHETILGKIPCRVMKPIQLGEGAGVGKVRGPQEVSLREGATLRDLVQKGMALSQAAVSCVVRLREEFDLLQEVPILIVVDEFNSWFTFSSYHESTGTRSRRPIHARELSMVHAFRTMEGPLMMATAFSQSLAIGKLPVHLPGLTKGVRFTMPRYSLEEATAVLNYYHRRRVTSKEELTDEDIRKLFFLTNGNGEELRRLVRLL